MKSAVVTLESISPLSQSAPIQTAKESKELHEDYEKRVWMERAHIGDDGFIFIPPMAFKNCLMRVAKYLGEQIPGQGKKTWTAKFTSGVMNVAPLITNVDSDHIESEWLFVPSDGTPGGGKRVWKKFPLIKKWTGDIEFYILDEVITKDVFEHHLEQAGSFIGVGRFRPERGGYYGRFKINDLKWS